MKIRLLCTILMLAMLTAFAVAQDDLTFDPPTLTEVMADMASDDSEWQWFGLSAFAEHYAQSEAGAAALPLIVKLLDSPEPHVRREAVLALATMRQTAATAEAKLRQLMENDPDEFVRGYAELAYDAVRGEEVALPGDADFGLEDVPEQAPTTTTGRQLPQANAGITDFLQPLRDHEEKLEAIEERITALVAEQPADNAQARRWTQDIREAGQDLIAESKAFRTTLSQFIASPKRRGLQEEFALIESCFKATDAAAVGICNRTKFDVEAYQLQQALSQQAAGTRQKLLTILAEEIDYRLEAEGLFVLLTTDGIAAVRNEAANRLRTGVEDEVEEITERELGIAFHDRQSFGRAVQHKLRSLVRGKVHELLFRITSNEIVVEIVGVPIIRWLETDLWPKLKEAFRNKGDLDVRTQRSVASLQRAEQRLWALPTDARLETVEAARRDAAGTMKAMHYLIGDVQRANRADLYRQLESAAERLAWVIDTTAHRFLLDKAEDIEKLETEQDVYRALIAMIEAMVREIEDPAEVAGTTVVAEGQPESGGAGFMRFLTPVEDPELAERISGGMGARDRDGGQQQEPFAEIAGVYDGRGEGAAANDFVVTLSGDPLTAISWNVVPSAHGGQQFSAAGAVTDTGRVVLTHRVFTGYFEQPGEDNGWAEIKMSKQNGVWVPQYLDIWKDGRPGSAHGRLRIALTRQ